MWITVQSPQDCRQSGQLEGWKWTLNSSCIFLALIVRISWWWFNFASGGESMDETRVKVVHWIFWVFFNCKSLLLGMNPNASWWTGSHNCWKEHRAEYLSIFGLDPTRGLLWMASVKGEELLQFAFILVLPFGCGLSMLEHRYSSIRFVDQGYHFTACNLLKFHRKTSSPYHGDNYFIRWAWIRVIKKCTKLVRILLATHGHVYAKCLDPLGNISYS